MPSSKHAPISPKPARAGAGAGAGGGAAAAAAARTTTGAATITPPYWDRTLSYTGVDYRLHPLLPTSQAYQDTAGRLFASISPADWQIVSVELLQHPRKWASYHAQRAIMSGVLAGGWVCKHGLCS